jgi:alpha-mannosidase
MFTFHLIANAHLDPVWLWDWREGLNEGIITCRTILDLMDADPELTFIRGESAIYAHIEKHDPETFERIKTMVAVRRWDIVGGTVVQPDTNLPATETFARHFARAGAYFESRFGLRPRIAWAADSFGHAAGLPDILAAAGMEGYAFTRPGGAQVPLSKAAFWWEGAGGGRVLAYRPSVGWYGSERDELPRRLNALLEAAKRQELTNIGVFYGVGNHGGGPTRRQIADIREWAEAHTDEVTIVHSGLHRLFDALRAELAEKGEDSVPTHQGEMNYVLRGCYSSVAKFKFPYRRTEAALSRAETTASIISAATETPVLDLGAAWDTLLFNSFHDILPGTSIERAFDDQIAQLGGAIHAAQTAELTALNALAAHVDTTVPTPDGDHPTPVAFLVWNPSPVFFAGYVELEAALDYRPIWSYRDKPDALPVVVRDAEGTPVAHQQIAIDSLFSPNLPWRRRVLAPVLLPPLGWTVMTMGWEEGVMRPLRQTTEQAFAPDEASLSNGELDLLAVPGESGIHLLHGGELVFGPRGLSLVTVADPWGSWGGMGEEPESLALSQVLHEWRVTEVSVRENGPERASLWVRLTGGNSWTELTFSLTADRPSVDVSARVLWNERSSRLKLVMPVRASSAAFDVPGGTVVRNAPTGEVPGGRWVNAGPVGFASDALYNFDLTADGVLRATICRASRYAAEQAESADTAPWHPAVDCGELRFRFLLTLDTDQLSHLARELETPPVALIVPPSPGRLPRTGSLAALSPESVRLLALKPSEDGNGWILRIQNEGAEEAAPDLMWMGETRGLKPLASGHIATYRLIAAENDWAVMSTTITETAKTS